MPKPPRRKARWVRPRWQLATSCWQPRMEGNSRDFLETEEAMRRLFEADWAVAVRAHDSSLAMAITLSAHGQVRGRPVAPHDNTH